MILTVFILFYLLFKKKVLFILIRIIFHWVYSDLGQILNFKLEVCIMDLLFLFSRFAQSLEGIDNIIRFESWIGSKNKKIKKSGWILNWIKINLDLISPTTCILPKKKKRENIVIWIKYIDPILWTNGDAFRGPIEN